MVSNTIDFIHLKFTINEKFPGLVEKLKLKLDDPEFVKLSAIALLDNIEQQNKTRVRINDLYQQKRKLLEIIHQLQSQQNAITKRPEVERGAITETDCVIDDSCNDLRELISDITDLEAEISCLRQSEIFQKITAMVILADLTGKTKTLCINWTYRPDTERRYCRKLWEIQVYLSRKEYCSQIEYNGNQIVGDLLTRLAGQLGIKVDIDMVTDVTKHGPGNNSGNWDKKNGESTPSTLIIPKSHDYIIYNGEKIKLPKFIVLVAIVLFKTKMPIDTKTLNDRVGQYRNGNNYDDSNLRKQFEKIEPFGFESYKKNGLRLYRAPDSEKCAIEVEK